MTSTIKLQKKYIIIGIVALVLVFIIGLSVKPIMNYFDKKEIASVIEVLDSENEVKNIDQCRAIMNFNKETVSEGNDFFDENKFDKIYSECDNNYNLEYLELDEENCRFIIRESERYFARNYIKYDGLEDKRSICSRKYLNPNFSSGAYFDINNDFKSQIFIDFELDFFRDSAPEGSQEYIDNRVQAKKRLVDLIEINNNSNEGEEVVINLDDVYLYPQRAILNVNLVPLTTYTISLKPYETDMGENTNHREFTFTTPENKYFGVKVVEPLTVYTKNNLPTFQIVDYNTEKTTTNVEVCELDRESYALVEVYLRTKDKASSNEFFISSMPNVSKTNCKTLNIPYKDADKINLNELVKSDFSFRDFVEAEDPTGLYMLNLVDSSDILYNERVNKPIIFSVANSHIMMKLSRNGEGFFFVNDFAGNPLPNQEIVAYLNDYEEISQIWNDSDYTYETNYNLPKEAPIFTGAIVIGTTGEDGVLKVDMKSKIEDAFDRTFVDEWGYDWSGLYKTFLLESSGNGYKSYLASTWNAGIAPWNFGYTTNYTWDENETYLSRWDYTPQYRGHAFPDRTLYLPGESVNLKIVLRNATDLSVPNNNEDFDLVVYNSKGEEMLNKKFKVNEYGSYSETIPLGVDAPLGSYSISINKDDVGLVYSGFQVEVFKNPKFYNDVSLTVDGLNGELVDITETEEEIEYYYPIDIYKGSFRISGMVNSKYYSGGTVKNASFLYKVYKQYYYDDAYWDECYYGCYYEPYKEFYTEGKGTIDENGIGKFDIDVEFESSYSDYKYIVEVTVTDEAGDTITGSNSVIARLPAEYKRYNRDLDIYFESDSKFAKVGKEVKIIGGLNVGDWTKEYNDKYIFAIKRKEYKSEKVIDANGYTRTLQKVNEIVDRVFFVNYDDFKLLRDGKIELDYELDETAEYVFEYGAVDSYYVNSFLGLSEGEVPSEEQLERIVNEFDESKMTYLEGEVTITYPENICPDDRMNEEGCSVETEEIVTRKLNLSDFIYGNNYLTIITYDDSTNASNPIINDNKLRVLTEKVSYKVGETAKVLIRLPVSNSKILWTIEKNGIVDYEYIDVPGNVFFKEFKVDDSYSPNTYIGVMMVDTNLEAIPEYKVGYTEVVIDKTDKKSFIEIKADKDTYKPRDSVNLDFVVKDINGKGQQTELTVMVVDDSLISLMGNVDTNILEKIFVKLPFNVQTSITNIAMLNNYYFSRLGIVGGSGEGDYKGGDSAVSTRNVFKNSAYYNPSVITDTSGKASVKFTLPDNLTNFRVMVISNSKDNHYGYEETYLNVRKNVIIEDRTPLILRDGDVSAIGANIFNNGDTNLSLKVNLSLSGATTTESEKTIIINAGDSSFVTWNIEAKAPTEEIVYTISALGNSADNSDKMENTIVLSKDPTLIRNIIRTGVINAKSALNLESIIPTNTDMNNTKVFLNFSNSRLAGIEKILTSLIKYPYGCIEQTVSSTMPNIIVREFSDMFKGLFDMEEIEKNINDGVERILSMQNSDGGFVYWQGNSTSDLHITPYVLRSLVYMKNAGVEVPDNAINNAIAYLEASVDNASDNTARAEIFWALSFSGKTPSFTLSSANLDRHALIAYTYGLVLAPTRDIAQINSNIERIKGQLTRDNNENWYWDNLSDKAIFASLLLDYDNRAQDIYVEELIDSLYAIDWESYYYSTQSKNNAFIAFHKYLQKTLTDNVATFSFALGNYSDNKTYELGGEFPISEKLEFTLGNVKTNDNNLLLSINNTSDSKIYVDYVIAQYPEDKLKVEPYANGMSVTREYYEIIDESLLDSCSDDYYYTEHRSECSNAFRLIDTKEFNKGQTYKAKIKVTFPDDTPRRLLTIEDYLPGAFSVINSNFRTESSAYTEDGYDWQWSHKEFLPGVVMANAESVWSKEITLEYYFRPEFSGTYTLPPVTSYMMYNPLIRANGRFTNIVVK